MKHFTSGLKRSWVFKKMKVRQIRINRNININININLATVSDLHTAEQWTSLWKEILPFYEGMWVIWFPCLLWLLGAAVSKSCAHRYLYDVKFNHKICLLWQWSCHKKFFSCCLFLCHDPVHCYLNDAAITVGAIAPYTWFIYCLSHQQAYSDEGQWKGNTKASILDNFTPWSIRKYPKECAWN